MAPDRRSEGDPQRADFDDRFPRIAGYYGGETMVEGCRCGSNAAGDQGPPRLLVTLDAGLAARINRWTLSFVTEA